MNENPLTRSSSSVSRRRLLAATGGAAALTAIGGTASATPHHHHGYTNPVIPSSHPDPAVLRADGAFWLYSTNGSTGRLPVLTSPDLINWTFVSDGMPEIAPWSVSGKHWAPEVMRVGHRYHAYYTARRADVEQQAVSVAVSASPAGPFTDDRTAPLVGQTDEGGSIDCSPFRDRDGSLWLLWKNDGNADDLPSYIYLQRLSDDGLELRGEPQRIIGMDQSYETYTIEGPSVFLQGGRYYCIYSTGQYWNETYQVCWATAARITGPWTKPSADPLLASNDVASGPGHGMPIKVGPDWWYVYHAWQPDGEPEGRLTWLSRMRFRGNEPVIDGPWTENPFRPHV